MSQAQSSTNFVEEVSDRLTIHPQPPQKKTKMEAPVLERVCNTCKVSQAESNFSLTQRRKRGSAKCYSCILSEKAKRESTAKEDCIARQEAKMAQRREREAEDKRMESLEERVCAVCSKLLKKECFHIGQQKFGRRARCKTCVKESQGSGPKARQAEVSDGKHGTPTNLGGNDVLPTPVAVALHEAVSTPQEKNQMPSQSCSETIVGAKSGAEHIQSECTNVNAAKSLTKETDDKVTNNAAAESIRECHAEGRVPAKLDKSEDIHASGKTLSGTPGRVKRKTTTTEAELDDGTKIVETETVESHPDGTVVTTINMESILETIDELTDGSKTVKKTVTKSTTEITKKTEIVSGAPLS
ncbi:hypothetical protein ACHAWF_010373 [Thalassiosira exigua]